MFINNLGFFFAEVTMKTCSATENMVIEKVSNFLKWAPERKDGGGRKNYFFLYLDNCTCICMRTFEDSTLLGNEIYATVDTSFCPMYSSF